jgi:glycosyltransferase involved in cell wall biosynthesis
MRIAVVDYYGPGILHKDPANITLGLRDIGVEALFVARNLVNEFNGSQSPFPLVSSAAIETVSFWSDLSVDAVLLISRLAPDSDRIVAAIKAAGVRLILKVDSDGTLGYPLVPNYLRTLSWRNDPLRTLIRHAKWRFPMRRYVGKKINQIAMADAVIVESPKARINILSILKHWKCEHLSLKVRFVPNPVAPDVFALDAMIAKKKLVMAVGRWEDFGPKNTHVMVRSIIEFLQMRKDYQALIVGSGNEVIKHILEKFNSDLLNRLSVLGVVDHSLLAQRLAEAQILFMPSRMESFGIVAAEALCVGCSIAVTPIESLEYLAADGFSGTVACGFDTSKVKEALLAEVKRWDAGEHSSLEISEYWRARLDRRAIAATIQAIAEASSPGS